MLLPEVQTLLLQTSVGLAGKRAVLGDRTGLVWGAPCMGWDFADRGGQALQRKTHSVHSCELKGR